MNPTHWWLHSILINNLQFSIIRRCQCFQKVNSKQCRSMCKTCLTMTVTKELTSFSMSNVQLERKIHPCSWSCPSLPTLWSSGNTPAASIANPQCIVDLFDVWHHSFSSLARCISSVFFPWWIAVHCQLAKWQWQFVISLQHMTNWSDRGALFSLAEWSLWHHHPARRTSAADCGKSEGLPKSLS